MFICINIKDKKIAPLIFLPFVENSFKHGLSNEISKGFVHLFLEVNDEKIEMRLENSKAPSQPHQQHKRSGGIGLVNVRRRLELLYPGQYELEIKDNPNTYEVLLKLDLAFDNS